ncbi:AAEL009660-PA, partial [Aedes aegypti]
SRQRRKGPIKLRFHHQALPPEYLDHYEATQNIAAKREQQQQLQNYGGTRASRMEKHAEQEREDRTNESVRNWLQKILELQKEGVSLAPVKDETESSSQRLAQGTQRNKVVSYSDLPYMGEMTLENSKPRRGRKPKKADICHLIYKNYGTILPGTPKPETLQERSTNGHRAQTRSSKREEPLNLCVRDGGGDPLDLSSSENESDGKLVDTNNTITPGQSSSSTSNSVPSTPTEILSSKLPITSNHLTPSPSSPVAPKQEPQHTLTPKPISQLIKPEKTSNSKTDSQSPTSKSSPPTQKRKRSAIFIPPVPAENSTNPATEVSICKFKFTGGAKPCLQEKKMLSVDSGGNFRYYSGTGDKSMRGYEFFPRESLQQSTFLNTPPVEKIACDLPPPSLGLSNDILQIPDFPSAANLTGLASPGNPLSQHRRQQPSEYSEGRRARRRSRRSSQRESLEKTFKEKGFLIQTQQMQSAEGATYCKFRQLRKFTRYLFRSWKDYLP